jgi:hypothetical protein
MSWRLGDEIVACKICRMQDQWCPEVAHWLCPALPAGVDLPDMQRMLGAWIDESDAARLPLGRRAITDKKSGHVIGEWPCCCCRPVAPTRRAHDRWPWRCGVMGKARRPVTLSRIIPLRGRLSVGCPRSCGGATIVTWPRHGRRYGMGRRDHQIRRVIPSGLRSEESGPGSGRAELRRWVGASRTSRLSRLGGQLHAASPIQSGQARPPLQARRSPQRCCDVDFGSQGLMNRAAFGDVQQPLPLSVAEVAGQFDVPINRIDPSAAGSHSTRPMT